MAPSKIPKDKTLGYPSSRKEDSILYKRIKDEEKIKKDQDETANVLSEFLAEFGENDPKKVSPKKNITKSNFKQIKLNDDKSISYSSDKTKRKAISSGSPPNLDWIHEDPEKDINNTTLYIGNLPPTITTTELMQIFIDFGPIGNIKHCLNHKSPHSKPGWGFVTFMCHSDAEMALRSFKEKPNERNIFVSWGKESPPGEPKYLPECYKIKRTNKIVSNNSNSDFNEKSKIIDTKLDDDTIYVNFPDDWSQMKLIHRFIEFIVREGPLFEAFIINREINNPRFRFILDYQSQEHIYYRWKMFSILQGDSQYFWSQKPFQMFTRGPYWIPPPLPPGYKITNDNENKPEEISELIKKKKSHTKYLTKKQTDYFYNLLRNVTVDKSKICQIMVWALDHIEYSKEIVDVIYESLSIKSTSFSKKIARLFVLNDILYNSSIEKSGSGEFRRNIEKYLPEIFEHLKIEIEDCKRKVIAEKMKNLISSCLNAWQKWLIFTPDFIRNLRLKIISEEDVDDMADDIDGVPITENECTKIEAKVSERLNPHNNSDIDGEPLSESEIDSILARKIST